MANTKAHKSLEKKMVSFRVPNLIKDWLGQKNVSLTEIGMQAILSNPDYQQWIQGQEIEGKPAIEFAKDRGVELLPDESL